MQTRQTYDFLACIAIAVICAVAGALLLPRIGDSYSPTALFEFLRYLATQRGFWMLGLVAACLGWQRNPEARLQVGSWRELVALAASTLILSMALLTVDAGVWRDPLDSVGAAALVLLLLLSTTAHPVSGDSLGRLLRLALFALLFSVLFSAVSMWHTVGKAWLFVAAEPRDDLLEWADELVAGDDFYVRLQHLRQSFPGVVAAADWIYVAFMQQFVWAGFYFAFVGKGEAHNARIWALSVFLAYFAGTLSYFLLPSYGPAFARPELFSDLQSPHLVVDDLQAMLASNTALVQIGPLGVVPIFGFIAAMPSLHVAATVLAALCTSGIMSALCWIWVVLTWLCTVVLGWHWISDGPAGALLALGCWAVARRLVLHSMQGRVADAQAG